MATIPTIIPLLSRALSLAASGLSIFSSLNVHLLVTDPAGRRTGFDGTAGVTLTEIPSSRYGVRFTGSTGTADSSRELDASFTGPDQLLDGRYTLRVTGVSSGTFHVSISVYREPLSEDFDLGGLIAPGETRIYAIVYDKNPSVPVWIDTTTTPPHEK